MLFTVVVIVHGYCYYIILFLLFNFHCHYCYYYYYYYYYYFTVVVIVLYGHCRHRHRHQKRLLLDIFLLFPCFLPPLSCDLGRRATSTGEAFRPHLFSKRLFTSSPIPVPCRHNRFNRIRFDYGSLELDGLQLIKIDCEGCEEAALLGAKRTISEFMPVVYRESNHENLAGGDRGQDFLLSLNYR